MNTNKTRQGIVIAALALTVLINMLANILPLNGQTTGQVSDKYPIYFTPAAYVFSIWTLIYIGLVCFAAYQSISKNQKNPLLKSIAPWFVGASFANGIWMILWHYEYIYASAVLMVILLICLCAIYFILKKHQPQPAKKDKWLVHIPFSLYLAWICVATIANIGVALAVSGWDYWGVAPELWSAIMIAAAGALALVMTIRFRDTVFPLVIAWAVSGIGLKFSDIFILRKTALITAGLLLIVSLFSIIKNRQTKK